MKPSAALGEIEPSQPLCKLSVEQDAGWLNQFGVTATHENFEHLQALIDADTPDLCTNQTNYAQAVDARHVFYRTVGLPITAKKQQEEPYAPRSTMMPLATTVGTLRVLHGAGLQTASIVGKMPTILRQSPTTVQHKLDNLTYLELNTQKVVEALPSIIGQASNKITLTAYTLMKYGLWEHTPNFAGFKALLNQGRGADIMVLPIESLLTYCIESKPPVNPDGLAKKAQRHMQQHAASATERKTWVREQLLCSADTRKSLGYLGVLYAMREHIADTYHW